MTGDCMNNNVYLCAVKLSYEYIRRVHRQHDDAPSGFLVFGMLAHACTRASMYQHELQMVHHKRKK